jgi:hypothetical protein
MGLSSMLMAATRRLFTCGCLSTLEVYPSPHNLEPAFSDTHPFAHAGWLLCRMPARFYHTPWCCPCYVGLKKESSLEGGLRPRPAVRASRFPFFSEPNVK